MKKLICYEILISDQTTWKGEEKNMIKIENKS